MDKEGRGEGGRKGERNEVGRGYGMKEDSDPGIYTQMYPFGIIEGFSRE